MERNHSLILESSSSLGKWLFLLSFFFLCDLGVEEGAESPRGQVRFWFSDQVGLIAWPGWNAASWQRRDL